MEAALCLLLPRLVGDRATWDIMSFRNKQRLLRELPNRLRGYARRLRSEPHLRIIVLIDSDGKPCLELKAQLEHFAIQADLTSKTRRILDAPFTVLNRIVVQELEAWFLGDVEALRAAFPKLPATLASQRRYRDPDTIRDTWECLHRALRQAGHLGEVYPKIEVARRVALHLNPERNRSRSFQAFRTGLDAILTT